MIHAARIAIVRRAAVLRRKWHRMMLVLALVAGVVSAAGAIAVGLARTPPGWWPAPGAEAAALRVQATELENGAVTLLYQQRAQGSPDPGWVAAIAQSDAEAWLNTKMPEWARDAAGLREWPPEVRQIAARFESGEILLGVRLGPPRGPENPTTSAAAVNAAPASDRYLSISLRAEVAPDGALYLRATSLRMGRLPLPTSLVLADGEPSALGSAARLPRSVERLRELGDLKRVLRGELPLLRVPVVQLGDGRRVRLRAVDAKGGRLLLSCMTEQRPALDPR